MSASRTLVGDTVFIQFAGQILHLPDAGFQIVEFGIFVQADGQCVHVASVHASISQITFELYAEAFGAFVPIFPVGCDETTHVDNAIFFRTHGHAVG